MTDVLSGRALVEKSFNYISLVTKECRKALNAQFRNKYKGIPFDTVGSTLKQEIESWFAKRDKNISIQHVKTIDGRPGEILLTFSGATKDAHFNFHVNTIFTLTSSSKNSSSYLKDMNIQVYKREFTR